jgi:transposase
MQPYSLDLRARVLADCDAGQTTAAVADKYSVSTAWVRRLKQRRRQTGEVGPRAGRPGPKPALAEHRDRLAALARARPGLSAAEYRDLRGVGVAAVTVWRALRGLGLTFKKSPARRRAGPARRGRGAGRVAGGGDARPRRRAAGVRR